MTDSTKTEPETETETETETEAEAPPKGPPREIPGLRAMAVVRWCLLLAVAAIAAGTWWTLVLRAEPITAGEARFYCPMHPQITSHAPGTCPICFMRLEPIPSASSAPLSESGAPPIDARADVGEAPPDLVSVMLTTERRQISGIATVAVREIALGGELRWPASVDAREGARSEVRVRAEGFVEHARVTETGARVRRGEVLASVYSPEVFRAQQELLTAHGWQGALTQDPRADPTRRRLELLGVSSGDIDAILLSGAPRRALPLRAPSSGTVTAYAAVVGAFASPDDVLYEIVDFSQVRVVASVLAPSDVANLGPTARFVPRGGGAPIDVQLELVEPITEGASRLTRVRYLAANPDGALRPGAIGDVVVARAGRSAIVVPRDATLDRGLAPYVFVEAGGGLFEPRVVELGSLVGEDREILRGLEVGERVVARGAFLLDSESRLQAALAPRTQARSHADGGAP